ncbi:MAG: hypothetical protein A2X94_13630 [Bdellovibrionales bacterium GWB1_55_8]|nr:MAG: hypothetical protein A2X94_13630 [Bdellovibrionales bacterium GWB1_55_8]
MAVSDGFRNSGFFCILPWVHARLNQDGNVYPCCRASEFYPYGSVAKTPFKEIWNSEAAKTMRLALIRGERLPQCSDCDRIDSMGGFSTRREMNQRFAHAFDRVESTAKDGFLDGKLLYLDLRFSNLCNLRCRSCGPQNSTAWYSDAQGMTESSHAGIIRPFEESKDFWAFFDELLPDLQSIYFAGGEPLLEDMHYELLEKLLRKGRRETLLTYNTNFSTLSHKQWQAPDLWRNFQNVVVSASLDGVGEQLELLRKGMRWAEVEKNHERLSREAPGVEFRIYSTVTAMNAFHITDAIGRFLELGMLRTPAQLTLNVALGPPYVSLNILNEGDRTLLRERYGSFLASLPGTMNSALANHIGTELKRVLGYLALPVDWKQRERFRRFTFSLDRKRGERFALLFPEHFELLYNPSGDGSGSE